jgi:hypothetical protein
MQLYEKYTLDCDNLIKKYCAALLATQWNYRTQIIFRISKDASFMSVLKEEMREKNLPSIRGVSIFCRGPNDVQTAHIDTRDNESLLICRSGFYIPLISIGSKLIWLNPAGGTQYIVKIPPEANSNKIITSSLMVQYKDYKSHIIGEYDSHDSAIINTAIPHSAISTKYPKAAIAIRLHDDVDLFEHFNLRP